MPAGWLILLLAVGVALTWLLVQRLRIVEDRVAGAPRQEDLAALEVPALVDQLQAQRRELRRMREALENVRRDQEGTEAGLRGARDESDGLQREVGELRELVVSLRGQVEALHQRLDAAPAGAVAPNDPDGPDLAPRITEALADEGFVDLRILGPLPEGEGSVLVEARRAGASYKGRVRVVDGDVDARSLVPCYKVFP